jgi:hypothetical protein
MVKKPGNIIELEKMTLWAKVPGLERSARMVFSLVAYKPRITVFTSNPADKGFDGIINATMDPTTFTIFLDMLRTVALSGKETKNKIEFLTNRKNESTGLTEQVLGSTLYFGKDEEGVCWISLTEGNKSKLKFEFMPPAWNHLYKSTGEKLTRTECSVANCLAYIKTARGIYNSLIALVNYNGVQDTAKQDQPDMSYKASETTVKDSSNSFLF